MPEAEYTTTTPLSVETVWAFVEDMDNWCHHLRGYQHHTRHSERDSTWLLKGDVGAVARKVEFRVHIDEWRPGELVHFTLEGVNEVMEGEGAFRLAPQSADGATDAAPPTPAAASLLARLWRWLYHLLFGRVERNSPASAGGASATGANLRFRLRVTPGGPMGPMVDALMKPLMLPVAEELAEKIMAELEARAAQNQDEETRP